MTPFTLQEHLFRLHLYRRAGRALLVSLAGVRGIRYLGELIVLALCIYLMT